MRSGSLNKFILFLILFWAMNVHCLHAQHNLSFYPMREQFNSFDYNPAFLTSPERFTFSMFPLAGFAVNVNHQDLVREALPKYLAGKNNEQDYDELFTRLIDRSSLYESAEVTFLNFTYRSNKGFFNFRVKDRQLMGASVKSDLTDFIFKNDIRSVALNQLFHYPAQAIHYREYSLGYSHTSPDKRLSLGIRGKLYYGKFAFYSSIDALVGSRANQYGLATTGMINLSYPASILINPDSNTYEVDLSKNNIRKYIWNNGNPGMGVDLGLDYKIGPRLNVSMSVIDLGRINWKKDPSTWDMTNGYPFYYATYGIEDVDGVPTITKREDYKYSETFNIIGTKQDSNAFTRALPATIYAGISYEVHPGFYLSATNRYVVMKNMGYNSLALGATADVNKRVTINTGYSIIGDSYFNIPLAFMYQHNYGQFYIGTDNINIFFTSTGRYWATLNFGACFYLFTQRNLLLKRLDYLPFYQPRKSLRNKQSGLRVKSKK